MTTVERAPSTGTDTALLVELAEALRRVRQGDFKVRLPRRTGLAGEVVDGFNDVVELQARRNRELLRISRVVGREGRMAERVENAPHPIERKIDQLGMQLRESRNDGIDRGHLFVM